MTENNNMVRINTRIPRYLNDWLDEQSKVNGIPKSTQVLLALELYYNQKNMPTQMASLAQLIADAKLLDQRDEKE